MTGDERDYFAHVQSGCEVCWFEMELQFGLDELGAASFAALSPGIHKMLGTGTLRQERTRIGRAVSALTNAPWEEHVYDDEVGARFADAAEYIAVSRNVGLEAKRPRVAAYLKDARR